MINLLKTEFYKLFHSRSFWILEVFSVLLSGVLLVDSIRLTDNFFFAALYNVSLLFFLSIIFSTLFAGNDFGERTLYTCICTGHKRSSVLLIKALVYEIACIIFLLLPVLIYSFIGVLYFKKSVLLCIGWETGVTILAAILTMCLLPFFFAVIFRDAGRSLAVSIVIFSLMVFVMNGDYAQQIGTILPIGQLRLIALQQTVSELPMIIADILWSCILYVGANFAFSRFDLK